MDCQETYTVVSGDTCNGINDKFSLTANQLYANNPQIDTATCNNLYVGEVLCVAQRTFAYPIVQLPSSSPMNAPIVSTTPSPEAPAVTPSSSATATPAPAATSATDVEYCADDDESPECVWEEDLPYCDEQ
jgi:LysM repeat protein